MPTKSDGGKNSFYKFPEWVSDVDSLARYLKLNPAEFNILKSLTSKVGKRHNATDENREAKKCLHYAVERMRWLEISDIEISKQVLKQIGENNV